MSLLVFLVMLGVLVTIHEFGHFIAAKKAGVKVERFAIGFGPKLFSVKRRETEYALCAVPLGGYVKLAGDNLEESKGAPDEFLVQPRRKRLAIVLLGPVMNYLLGFVLLSAAFYSGYPLLFTRIEQTLPGSPAQTAGLSAGDDITAIDGIPVKTWNDVRILIMTAPARQPETIRVSLRRDTAVKEIAVPYLMKELVDEKNQTVRDKKTGEIISYAYIGIAPATVRIGLARSLARGAVRTWDITALTYRSLWMMITGKLSLKESTAGIVGIYAETSRATRVGLWAVILLAAVLSLSLAIINLLPLPALDGGHIFLLAIEQVRGKQMSKKTEDVLTRIGFGFLILLVVVVTYNDFDRLGYFEKIGKVFEAVAGRFKK